MRRRGEYGIRSLHGPRGLLNRLSENAQDEQLMRLAQETAGLVETEIRKRAPGPYPDPRPRKHLKENVKARVVKTRKGQFRIWASIPAHGVYPDEGTGIYGKRGQPIRAKSARGMRFFWHQTGRWVRAHAVQGQPGQHFMEKGRDAGIRIARRRFGNLIPKG